MDNNTKNPTDPNLSGTPLPTPPEPTFTPPPSDLNLPPQQSQTPSLPQDTTQPLGTIPPQPDPTPMQWGPPPPPSQPSWEPLSESPTLQNTPDPLTPQPLPSSQPAPAESDSVPAESDSVPASTWPQTPLASSQPSTPPPPPPSPEPTFPPIMPQDTPPASTSTLDNPWGASSQPPPIDSPEVTLPQTSQTPTESGSLTSSDSAPTDLSHLITTDTINADPKEAQAPETLVTPTSISPEVPNLSTEGVKGIPKWVIGLGVGLLIVVVGASAYFILGIGQPPQTSSIPATQEPTTTQQIKTPPVAQPSPQSAATGSASFGDLEGTRQATSAGDLLRQGQQGR